MFLKSLTGGSFELDGCDDAFAIAAAAAAAAFDAPAPPEPLSDGESVISINGQKRNRFNFPAHSFINSFIQHFSVSSSLTRAFHYRNIFHIH